MLTWDPANPEQIKISDHLDSSWVTTTVRDLIWMARAIRRLDREVLEKRRESTRTRSQVLGDAIHSDALRNKQQFERKWLRMMARHVPVTTEQPTVQVVWLDGSD
jgi:hypothetical protein